MSFVKNIISYYASYYAPHTMLLFLTKSDCVRNLLEMKHGGQTIVSFSVNTDKVWQYLEHRTPSPEDRLKAARKVRDAGYEVRLRIDPVVRYSTWEKDYRRLTEMIFDLTGCWITVEMSCIYWRIIR